MMAKTTTTLSCRRLPLTNNNFKASRLRMPTKKSPDRIASLCSGKSVQKRKKWRRKSTLKDSLMLLTEMAQIVLRH